MTNIERSSNNIDLANERINIGMIHKGTVSLESERLNLRQFVESDIGVAFNNLFSDGEVAKFVNWVRYTSLDAAKDYINRIIRSYQSPSFYNWAIVPKEVGEVVGSISAIMLSESTAKVQLGYCIGSRWWHQGFASEALSTVVPFFFDEVNVNRIDAFHEPNNPNSGKVMEKCGMRYEGTLREYFLTDHGLIDACMYSLLRREYLKSKIK